MKALAETQQLPYYYEIIKNLILRDLKVKYKRSSLGFFWTLLNPLFMASVYIFVFSKVMRAGIDHYWAFLLSGFFPWNFFALTLASGSDVIFANRSIVTRVYFPNEILVISNTLSKLIELFFEMAIVIPIISIFYLHRLPPALAVVPYLMFLQVVLSIGFVLPLAALKVFYRDVEQVLPIIITGWFFLTPIVYTPQQVPPQYSFLILTLNPMSGIIAAYQDVFYWGRFPDLALLLRTSVSALGIFAVGYWVFNRYKGVFAEIV